MLGCGLRPALGVRTPQPKAKVRRKIRDSNQHQNTPFGARTPAVMARTVKRVASSSFYLLLWLEAGLGCLSGNKITSSTHSVTRIAQNPSGVLFLTLFAVLSAFFVVTMALFPRFQLFEIEDMSWCPSWLREYSHRALHQMWNTVGPGRTSSTAAQACDILVSKLPEAPSAFTFVDACAGAGGPTPMLERSLNTRLHALGQKPVRFVLADLYPDWAAWKKITSASENISFISKPVDATTVTRYVDDKTLECRLFNLCFHHFDNDQAAKILRASIQGSDAFV